MYSKHSAISTIIANACISWIFLGLRCYVRIHLVKRFGWDDWLAMASSILHMVCVGLDFNGYINHGFGVPLTSFPPERQPGILAAGLRDLIIAVLVYIISTGLIKLSFALTLLRIVRDRSHVILLQVTMAVTVIISLYYFLLTIFECSPVSYAWGIVEDPYWALVMQNKDPGPLKPRGTCIPHHWGVHSAYAHSAMLIAVDVVLAVVAPALLLKELHMKMGLKIGTSVLLAFGGLASIATVVRLYHLKALNAPDVPYAAGALIFWSDIELSWSLIATSLACLKPLAVKLGIVKEPTNKQYKTRDIAYIEPGSKNTVSHVRSEYDIGDVEKSWAGSKLRGSEMLMTTTDRSKSTSNDDLSASQGQLQGEGANAEINKTIEVQHTYQDRR